MEPNESIVVQFKMPASNWIPFREIPKEENSESEDLYLVGAARGKSLIWNYFKKYDKKHHEGKNIYVVCQLCFLKSKSTGLDDLDAANESQVNYGKSQSTGKLSQHLRVHHREEWTKYQELIKPEATSNDNNSADIATDLLETPSKSISLSMCNKMTDRDVMTIPNDCMPNDYSENLDVNELVIPKTVKSACWKYFRQYPSSANRKEYAVCLLCVKMHEELGLSDNILQDSELKYGMKKCTSKLVHHLRRRHKAEYDILMMEKEDEETFDLNRIRESDVTHSVSRKKSRIVNQNQETIDAYVCWIATMLLPTDTFESNEYQAMMYSHSSKFVSFTHEEVTDRVQVYYGAALDLLKEKLHDEYYSLSFEHWDCNIMESCDMLTLTFIDINWKLHKFVLHFNCYKDIVVTPTFIVDNLVNTCIKVNLDSRNCVCCVTDSSTLMTEVGNLLVNEKYLQWHACLYHRLDDVLPILTDKNLDQDMVKELAATFVEVQGIIDSVQYVTIGLLPLCIFKVRECLCNIIDQEDTSSSVRALSRQLLHDFNSKWGLGNTSDIRNLLDGIPNMILCASFLDIRTKALSFMNRNQKQHMITFLKLWILNSNIGLSTNEDNVTDETNYECSSGEDQTERSKQLDVELSTYQKNECCLGLKSSPPVDPLLWWKGKQSDYPILAATARRFLCMSGSFSTSTEILSQQKINGSIKRDCATELMLLNGILKDFSNEMTKMVTTIASDDQLETNEEGTFPQVVNSLQIIEL